MKNVLLSLAIALALVGCKPNGPQDTGVGDPAYTPSGSGGQGGGETGTSGDAPSENPGAGLPGDNGTGTN